MACNGLNSNLLNDYYIERKTVKSIVSEHDLEVPNRIFERFPVYQHKDMICECCGNKLVSNFASRDSSTAPLVVHNDLYEKEPIEVDNRALSTHLYRGRFLHLENSSMAYLTDEQYAIGFPYCQSCGHEPSLKCQCDNCIDIKERNSALIQSRVSQAFDSRKEPLLPDDYSTKDIFIALYLLTYQIEDLDKGFVPKAIGPVSKDHLLKSALLTEDTSEEAISSCIQMVSNFEFIFSPEKIPYTLNVNFEGDKLELLAALKKRALKTATTMDGQIELVEIWSELALQEALNVLKHYCTVFSLPYRPGETIVSTVKRCLNKYGLAQSARYIYNSTKNAHTYALEKGISGPQAFNSINGSINFWMDNEKCRNWHAPPFSRGREVLEEPQHTIVFTHSFLENYGVDFFTLPINLKSFS